MFLLSRGYKPQHTMAPHASINGIMQETEIFAGQDLNGICSFYHLDLPK